MAEQGQVAEEILQLFEQCMQEADMHTAVGLYGYVGYEEVFRKRGAEWLAAHDEQVRSEGERAVAERIAEAIEDGAYTLVSSNPAEVALSVRRQAARLAREEAGS